MNRVCRDLDHEDKRRSERGKWKCDVNERDGVATTVYFGKL